MVRKNPKHNPQVGSKGHTVSEDHQLPRFRWMNTTLRTIAKLGEGTYGSTYHCKASCLHVAVKVAKPEPSEPSPHLKILDLAEEYGMLCRFTGCPWVVRAWGLSALDIPGKSEIGIVMEFCQLTLSQAMSKPKDERPPLGVFQNFCFQVVSGLTSIHSKQVVHLDLKPDNILLKMECGASDLEICHRAVIADFGLAESTSEDGSLIMGLRCGFATGYRCPELTSFGPKYPETSLRFLPLHLLVLRLFYGKRKAYPFEISASEARGLTWGPPGLC